MILSNISKFLSRGSPSPSPSADILYPSEDCSVTYIESEQPSRLSIVSATDSISNTRSREHMRSRTVRNDGCSVSSTNSTSDNGERRSIRNGSTSAWSEHISEAGGDSLSFATCLYAIFMIVFLLVEEGSLEAPPEKVNDFKISSVFSFYMYTIGIGFFLYLYLFVIYPYLPNRILHWLSKKGMWKNAKKYSITPASHDSEAVNSLYLRVGIVFFGTMGVVLFGMLMYLLFANVINDVNVPSSVIEAILGVIFIFLQMLFMTVNYKVAIKSSKNICRFGFMHNFAVNIWTWHRFAIAKFNESIAKHIHRLEEREALLASLTTTLAPVIHFFDEIHGSEKSEERHVSVRASREILVLLEHFGELAIFLSSCLIEYSLIGAAVMFVFWKHLDSPKKAVHEEKLQLTSSYSKRGFFLGVAIAIVGCVVAGVYGGLANNKWAYRTLLFGGFDSLCYVLCIAAVVLAARLMRSMNRSSSHHGEDVDDILLYIAFVGEVVWSSAEITNFMSGRVDNKIGVHILNVSLVRLIHVFTQTWFILGASRLHFSSSTNESAMRGRECVTFLLMVNITMFFFCIYESQNDRFGFLDELSSTQLYMKLYAAPITVFYRFHSSVCLAEIWQKSFARPKNQLTRVNPLPVSPQPLFTIVTID